MTREESREARSRTMRAVKSRDTTPELAVRRLLFAMGFRYRIQRKDLPGKPDIVFPSRKKVVFVHGCFWHGHECPRGARVPKTNTTYWRKKIAANIMRDAQHIARLRQLGWEVLLVWECQVKDTAALQNRLAAYLNA
ncbi:MAG: very short patch repair endonuclease [Desulfovibrio sp.]|uniref:Very short patch repair endonuclease n=1 Tax=Megalodesulfovibrio gigas (strain ATCC 19364 / DSM 1382 / NCIMB 9332 / VKM B-1759) TaxID=1121448 RepID=T2G8A5_MEGG1|nr:very short patch repair endonuclease [Megalodesulfovibrio gigas]AGW12820.1 putative DNA G:T-mismatch repair endonuclease [Megalodesulfovibrio gigas DSM 1382 = ATCC 19364]MCA1944553.1 very short patch repair endonuclease [Desulfovibrio sp.]MCA1986081.1 very short patch repair endonuclease [Desulfovibrio sp.]